MQYQRPRRIRGQTLNRYFEVNMNRLTQGSTWAGLGVMLATISNFVPGQYSVFVHAAAAAAAAIAGALNS